MTGCLGLREKNLIIPPYLHFFLIISHKTYSEQRQIYIDIALAVSKEVRLNNLKLIKLYTI